MVLAIDLWHEHALRVAWVVSELVWALDLAVFSSLVLGVDLLGVPQPAAALKGTAWHVSVHGRVVRVVGQL